MIHQFPSPNFDERINSDGIPQPVDMLIMHYTGMKTGQEALDRMCDAQAKVSAHFMVEEDGRVFQLVDEGKRAWHAGVSSWRGETNINARSIGIEVVNPGHEWGYREFPKEQIGAVITLSQAILTRHDIPARNVVGHSDVAPMRKQDPGELFPWQGLAEQGVGLWPDRVQSSEFRVLEDYLSHLQSLGYGISENVNEEEVAATIIAFQRHFRPHLVNGKWDDECATIVESLISKN